MAIVQHVIGSRWLSAANCLVASYALLAWALWSCDGVFTTFALALTVASFLFLLTAAGRFVQDKDLSAPSQTGLALASIFLFSLSAAGNPGIYVLEVRYATVARQIAVLMMGVLLLLYVDYGAKASRIQQVFRGWAFAACLVLLGLLPVGMPWASPTPRIDVWTTAQDSARHLLQGANPYTTPVEKIYGEGVAFGYVLKAYNYPPANLYAEAPAYALLGDVRYALIAAMFVFLGCLWALSRSLPGVTRQLLLLLALSHPRLLFVLEQAWTEPLVLAALGLTIVAHVRNWPLGAALACGLMLSLKQYLLFFACHWLLLERRWFYLLCTAGVVLLTLFPFLLIDAVSLWNEGILFQLRTGFRSDSLTIASAVYSVWGIAAPKWWSVVVGGLAAGLTPLALRALESLPRYLCCATITTFAMFLFGSQAFTNYYFLVGALLLLLLAQAPRGESASSG